MPLVRIDAVTADLDLLSDVGNAVHAALVTAFGIPPDDLFQVLNGGIRSSAALDGGAQRLVRYDPDYLGVQRDDGVVIVQVFLRQGRSSDAKRAFYQELARLAPGCGVEPRNLMVVLTENDLADWSFGDGVAQYLDSPPAGGQAELS